MVTEINIDDLKQKYNNEEITNKKGFKILKFNLGKVTNMVPIELKGKMMFVYFSKEDEEYYLVYNQYMGKDKKVSEAKKKEVRKLRNKKSVELSQIHDEIVIKKKSHDKLIKAEDYNGAETLNEQIKKLKQDYSDMKSIKKYSDLKKNFN